MTGGRGLPAYLLGRLARLALVVLGVTALVFFLLRTVPGDPIRARYGIDTSLSQEDYAALRAEYGLDQPAPVQYVRWLQHAAKGDLGESILQRRDVSHLLWKSGKVTLQVQTASFLLALIVGVGAGSLAAIKAGSWTDRILSTVSLAGVAAPSYFLGILLILLFAVRLDWLPVTGWHPLIPDVKEGLRHLALPALTGALAGPVAVLLRYSRAALLEVLQQDYVRTARSKGLSTTVVTLRHALPNASVLILSVAGLMFANVLAGSVIIERLFTIPGMGRLVTEAVVQHDYPLVQGAVLVIAIVVVLVNTVVDLLYSFVDPRIRR